MIGRPSIPAVSPPILDRQTDRVLDETKPTVIKGLNGQRVLALATASGKKPKMALPKVYADDLMPGRFDQLVPLRQNVRTVLEDNWPIEFARSDGKVFNVLGKPMPSDVDPLNVIRLEGNRWRVKGANGKRLVFGEEISSKWSYRPAPGDPDQYFSIPDAVVSGKGWIVLYLKGRIVDGYFVLSRTPQIKLVEVLTTDYSVTLSDFGGSTKSESASFGMLPLAYVVPPTATARAQLFPASSLLSGPRLQQGTIKPALQFSTFGNVDY